MNFFQRLLFRFLFVQLNFAAGAGALDGVGGGGGTGSGTGTGTGSGGNNGGSPSQSGALPASSSGTGGTGTGTGTGQGSPGQGNGTLDWSTAPAHFRTAYEQLKSQHDPWSKMGMEHSVASSYVNTAKGMVTESYKVGRELGYSDSDIQEALQNDVVNTLTFLRSAAAKRQSSNGNGNGGGQSGNGQGGGNRQQPQVDPTIKSLLDQRLAPLEQHTNNALAEAANSAFKGEFNRLFDESYGTDAADMPKEIKDLLYDACSEVMKRSPKALEALKFRRDVSSVTEVFKTVRNRFDQAFNAYHTRQLSKGGGQGQGGGGQKSGNTGGQGQGQGQGDNPWAGLSLDDIAQGDPRAIKLIPSMG